MADLDLTAATDAAARQIMNVKGCYESSSFVDSCGVHGFAGPWVYRAGETGTGWCPEALTVARAAVEAAAPFIAELVLTGFTYGYGAEMESGVVHDCGARRRSAELKVGGRTVAGQRYVRLMRQQVGPWEEVPDGE